MRIRFKLALGLAIMAACFLFSQGSVSAAPAYNYPDDGDATHYLSVSRNGVGINLNAPYSYLKANYSPGTVYHDIEITDACYFNNVDGGTTIAAGGNKPNSCRAGDVEFFVCPSTPSGSYDGNMKTNGQCYRADPANWPGGTTTQLLRFADSGCGCGAYELNMPEINGEHWLYVVAEMKVMGLNGFKVRSVSRNGSLAAAGNTRVGLGGQMSTPLSLVHLPLGAGDTQFRARFQVPCNNNSGSFQLGWFDADRPPSTTPQDPNISWTLYNETSGQSLTSGTMAFFASMSEDTYLGGNNVDGPNGTGNITIGNAGFFRVQAGDNYRFEWNGVNNNNGVQLKIPFDEADSGSSCASASCTFVNAGPATIGANSTFSVVIRLTNNTGHNWTAAATTGGSGHKVGSSGPRDNNTWGATRWVMPTIANGASGDVTLSVRAPASTGTYTLAFEVLEELAHWEVGTLCSRSIVVNNDPPVFSCPRVANINPRVAFDTNLSPNPRNSWFESTSDHDDDGVSGRTLYWTYTRDDTKTTHQIKTDGSGIVFAVGTSTPTTVVYSVPGTDYTHNDNSNTDHGILLNYSRAFSQFPYDTQLPTVRYSVTNVFNWQLNVDWADDDQGTDGPTNRPGSTATETVTQDRSSQGPRLGPCKFRRYDATPTGPLSAGLAPDAEEVTTATFTYRFQVQFGTEDIPSNPNTVAERSRLLLAYNVERYIDRWEGGTTPLAAEPQVLTVDATANQADSTLTTTPVTYTMSPAYIAAAAPNLRPGDRYCMRVTIPVRTAYASPRSANGSNWPTGGVGFMAVANQTTPNNRARVAGEVIEGTTSQQRSSNDTGPSSEGGYTCTEVAVNRPYFKAYGGDVVAGSNFKVNDTCTATAGAGITSWNRNTRAAVGFYGNTQYGGAGTQLAAYATGLISGFASASNRTANPTPMVGLSFSNSSDPGGNWATQNIGCMADYFNDRSVNAVVTPVASPTNLAGANGTFSGTGPFTFTGGTIPGGGIRRYTLYVNGDLAITGNIQLANATYNGIDEIPSVRLIATGDIYIDPSVTEINAILVSQGGTIYTCSRFDNDFAPPARDQITNPTFAPANARCRNKLTIYGALLADSIRFFRSNGSMRSSRRDEASGSGNIAEVIIYSPEVWLGMPSNIPPNEQPYDSFTGLPPIL